MSRHPESLQRFLAPCSDCQYVEQDGPFDVFRCKRSVVTGYVFRYDDGPHFALTIEERERIRAALDRGDKPSTPGHNY